MRKVTVTETKYQSFAIKRELALNYYLLLRRKHGKISKWSVNFVNLT